MSEETIIKFKSYNADDWMPYMYKESGTGEYVIDYTVLNVIKEYSKESGLKIEEAILVAYEWYTRLRKEAVNAGDTLYYDEDYFEGDLLAYFKMKDPSGLCMSKYAKKILIPKPVVEEKRVPLKTENIEVTDFDKFSALLIVTVLLFPTLLLLSLCGR